jgi:hypothetical protein
MEKKRFGPKLSMDALPKGSKAKVLFNSLPKAVETSFETGYGPDKNLKWEMDIELLEHPIQEVLGKMIWQTTANVVRIELMGLHHKQKDGTLTNEELIKDLKSCKWYICCDAKGQISIEEV